MIFLFFLGFDRFQYDGINLLVHTRPDDCIFFFHYKDYVAECIIHHPLAFALGLEEEEREVEQIHEVDQHEAYGMGAEEDIQVGHAHSMDVAALGTMNNMQVEVVQAEVDHEKNTLVQAQDVGDNVE